MTRFTDSGTLYIDNKGYTPKWNPGLVGSEDLAAVAYLDDSSSVPATVINGNAALRFNPDADQDKLTQVTGGTIIF